MYSIYVNVFVNIFCIIKIYHKWRNFGVYHNILRYLLTLIWKKKHKIPLLWLRSQFLTLNLNLSLRYARACSSYMYGCFILRAARLSNKLLEQGYVGKRFKSSLRKYYGRDGDLIKQYGARMLNDIM